jgi:hypothetical protein
MARMSRTGKRAPADHYPLTLLSTTGHDHLPEICCRCDEGLHGIGNATRAGVEALTVEVRYGRVSLLVDPGTHCYRGISPWRPFGADGPASEGRLLRSRYAHTERTAVDDYGDIANWAAEHDGYRSFGSPVRHRRSVLLDRASRLVDIIDQIEGDSGDFRQVFHFGPEIKIELDENCAFLSWLDSATPGAAWLELPLGLSWRLHRAETGTASGGPGNRLPVSTLQGRGRCVSGVPLATRLEFSDTEMLPDVAFGKAVSWATAGNCRIEDNGDRAGAK